MRREKQEKPEERYHIMLKTKVRHKSKGDLPQLPHTGKVNGQDHRNINETVNKLEIRLVFMYESVNSVHLVQSDSQ